MTSVTIKAFDNLIHREQVTALWEAVFGYETAGRVPQLAAAGIRPAEIEPGSGLANPGRVSLSLKSNLGRVSLTEIEPGSGLAPLGSGLGSGPRRLQTHSQAAAHHLLLPNPAQEPRMDVGGPRATARGD
jgi:hypothetical protein